MNRRKYIHKIPMAVLSFIKAAAGQKDITLLPTIRIDSKQNHILTWHIGASWQLALPLPCSQWPPEIKEDEIRSRIEVWWQIYAQEIKV